jgi:O-antigen/teichoic acid export membrane protein
MEYEKKIEKRRIKPNTSTILEGVSWTTFATIVQTGFAFIVRLVLARLLVPEHFGIIGMAVVFTGLVSAFNELGLSAALIQYKEGKLKDIHYHSAFWVNVFVSIIIFLLICILIGPFAAWFYNKPLLYPVTVVLSLPILINPLNVINKSILFRSLKFKLVNIAVSLSVIVSGIAGISMAMFGAGVWSIAFQGVFASLIVTPLMWYFSKWKPKISFSKKAFKEIFDFGAYFTANNVMVYFVKNIDYLLIGRLLGAEMLGIYTLAFLLTDIFRAKIMGILNTVLFPVYSKIQDDVSKVSNYYLKVLKYNTTIIFPLMTLQICFAESIVLLMFGEKWLKAVFPLQMLALAVMIHASMGTVSTVMRSIGYVKLDFYIYFIKSLLFTMPAIVIGIILGDINGVSIAIFADRLVSFFIRSYFVNKLLKVRFFLIIKSILPAFLGSIGVYVLSRIFYLFNLPPNNIIMLIIYLFIGLLVYILIVIRFFKKEKNMFKNIVKQKLMRRTS